MIRPILTLAVALSVLAVSLFAEAGPQFRDTKSQSLGRTGVASSYGATSLFLNPAGLGKAKGGGLGMSFDAGVNPILVDYAAWAADNYQYLDKTDTLVKNLGPVDNKWARFSQTLLVYGNWQGVGFGMLADNRYNLTVSKAVVTPVLGVGFLSDLVLTAGKGFQAEEGYRFGFALKYIYRLRFEDQLLGTTDEKFFTVKKAWEKPGNSPNDLLTKLKVAADFAETQQGVGLNLGAEKVIDKNWTAGLSLLDFPTVMNQRFVRPEINLGLAYHKELDLVPELDNKVLVNLDWQRFLIPGTPWFKQLKAGVALEGYMKKRPVTYLGVGLNDGYPTLGVRIGYIVYLSYIYISEETGTYAGQEKLTFHKLALQTEF